MRGERRPVRPGNGHVRHQGGFWKPAHLADATLVDARLLVDVVLRAAAAADEQVVGGGQFWGCHFNSDCVSSTVVFFGLVQGTDRNPIVFPVVLSENSETVDLGNEVWESYIKGQVR